MTARDMAKYAAMRPYFTVVAEALDGLVDGDDFFDMHADDVVVEYIITVPDYPRRIVGREALAELYSDYGQSIVQSGSSDVHRYYDCRAVRGGPGVHHPRHGRAHRCAVPQPIHLGHHRQGPQDRALARLPGSVSGVRRIRYDASARRADDLTWASRR